VSGPAIAARIGFPADEAPADHPVWDGVADALGQLCHTLVLTGIPRRIVMGGGVMGAAHLFPRVRAAMTRSLGGYITLPEVALTDTFIVSPALGNNAGPLGAIVLGAQALGHKLEASFTAS
jgi:fructokinase